MKTFFTALLLGVFIGAMITAYYNDPESFKSALSLPDRESDSASYSESPMKELKDKAAESTGKVADRLKEGANTLIENAREEREEIAEKGKEIIDSAKDAGIKAAISGRLKLDSSIDAARIEIEVVDGSVVLSGEVSSRAEERKARDIALDTRYVKDVRSELKTAP
jgi:osmotically-inducible protein OsmY